jgi:bifunctional enzyme CysN/CysC
MPKNVVFAVICGSVDDGKSTVLGRLLVDSNSIPADTLEQARTTRRAGSVIPVGEIDYSLLTDGLESEREQGITIDVAYRHMYLPSGRRLIMSDSPGHEQYTRNMTVATAKADIGLLLVDAKRGVRSQTIRHANICGLMGVKKLIVAVNKMDSVGYSQEVFNDVVSELETKIKSLGFETIEYIPVSGLMGDNVSALSPNTHWFTGNSIMSALNELSAEQPIESTSLRIPIQAVIRTVDNRGYAGQIASGTLTVGQLVQIYPSGTQATVSKITGAKIAEVYTAGDAVNVEFEHEIDAARGHMIAGVEESNQTVSRVFLTDLIWLSDKTHTKQQSYVLKCGPIEVTANVSDIRYVNDMDANEQIEASNLNMNDVARVEITLARPTLLDPYSLNRDLGGFILCDRLTQETVAAGMVLHSIQRESEVLRHDFSVNREQRETLNGHKSCVLWLTGLPSSGKSTIADEVEKSLFSMGYRTLVIDGDTVRTGLSSDLGFTNVDRSENVRRVAHLANLVMQSGVVAIVALVSPIADDRDKARELFRDSDYHEIFIDTPLAICESRDVKGLYKRAKENLVANMTGANHGYEAPENPELIVDGSSPLSETTQRIVDLVLARQNKP